jgi:hypothetical protein
MRTLLDRIHEDIDQFLERSLGMKKELESLGLSESEERAIKTELVIHENEWKPATGGHSLFLFYFHPIFLELLFHFFLVQ